LRDVEESLEVGQALRITELYVAQLCLVVSADVLAEVLVSPVDYLRPSGYCAHQVNN
jgi:hypothetical protein